MDGWLGITAEIQTAANMIKPAMPCNKSPP